MKKITELESKKIQILRGIAIIAVVLIHNCPMGLPQVYIRPFLNFSVGLFLFLSGYLSDAKKWNPKKRILKVIVPYIIWTAIYVIIYNYKEISTLPKKIIINLITGQAAPIMYYVLVYCQFTLFIPLIDKLARSKYKCFGFLISPLEIIFMRLIPIILGIQFNEYISIIINISCLVWFIYFYLGYLIGNKIISFKTPEAVYIYIYIRDFDCLANHRRTIIL